MRIAVSGTHCCGKSTLIADFLAAHREYEHEPEAYEWLQDAHGEEFPEEPTADDFYRLLEFSVQRIREYERGARVIIERSPLDYLAYMRVVGARSGLFDRAVDLAADAITSLDLLVFLPLNARDGIVAPASEDLELRRDVNDHLLDILLADDLGLLDDGPPVVEIRGRPDERLAALENASGGEKHAMNRDAAG